MHTVLNSKAQASASEMQKKTALWESNIREQMHLVGLALLQTLEQGSVVATVGGYTRKNSRW